MYSYLKGAYQGQPDGPGSGMIVIEVAGIGYQVVIPPIVEDEIVGRLQPGDDLKLWVSAQSTRDLPWPTLFGFLQIEERQFWELLCTLPRVGGKSAAKAISVPIARIAQAIQEGNKTYLDGLPGITLDGAEKMVAGLRKKVGPFLQTAASSITTASGATRDDEIRDDAIQLLTVMGVKRPDAQRGVDELLSTNEELVTVQDLITTYLRAYGRS